MSSLVSITQPPIERKYAQIFLTLVNFYQSNHFLKELQRLRNLKTIFDILEFIAQSTSLINQNINMMFSTIRITIPEEQLILLFQSPIETYQKLRTWHDIFSNNLTHKQQDEYRKKYGKTFIPADDLLTFLKEFYSLDTFQIYIKTVTGRNIELVISCRTSIDEICRMILDKDGIPVNQQRLIFAGKQLEDNRFAGEYNITKETTISLVHRLRGGMHNETSTGKLKNDFDLIKEYLSPELQELLSSSLDI